MTIKLSYDEGKTCAAQKTAYTGPAAYSSLSILPNGNIALLFEKDDYSENVFVRFTLDWLTDGRTLIETGKKQASGSTSRRAAGNIPMLKVSF